LFSVVEGLTPAVSFDSRPCCLAGVLFASRAFLGGESNGPFQRVAFPSRRLERLAATAGRFRLNAELPVPLDGRESLEVGLFCADAHPAIELDGAQPLAGAEAYRRDRRKDALGQGCVVAAEWVLGPALHGGGH
jgi:hypothetical protein